MSSLSSVICEILRSRDFMVSEKDGYLHARKGNGEVVFCLLEALDIEAVDEFLARYRDHPGKKVLAVLEPVPPSVAKALGRSVAVWDREVLEREIGRTRIEKMVGERGHGQVDDLAADDFPRLVSPEALEGMPETAVGERIVRPVIGVEDIKEISRQPADSLRCRLELVPHFVYGYICPLYSGARKVSVEQGRLSVNGLTGKVEKWDDRADVVYALETAHRRLEPVILPGEAEDLARQELVRANSFFKEYVREEKHVTVTERTAVSPREDGIMMEGLGTYYLPVWCVEGAHGVTVIDAGTGRVISGDRGRS